MKLAFLSGEHSHDDVPAVARRLRVHAQGDDHRGLAAFLHRSTVALKDEARSLPHHIRALVPSFEHVLDLVHHSSRLQGGPLAEPVQRALLCVLKISALIGHYELYPSTYDFDKTESCLLGLGVGVLVAAAVGLSPSISDLPEVGAEVVRLVFRCAFHVDRVARTLDVFDPNSPPNNWIYVILNESEQAVSDQLEAAKLASNCPETGKIFICNARPQGISVCGPPSRLRRLFEEETFFRQSNFIRMPCYGGPIHARHVFDGGNVSSIVTTSLPGRRTKAQVISPGSGRPFTASDATGLFRQIITYLLTEEVCWDRAVEYAAEWARGHGGNHYEIWAFRSSQQVQDVAAALQAEVEPGVVLTDDLMAWIFAPPAPAKPAGPQQSKIAIVGMACRFPGGATDPDKYWDLFESGRDVHQKVPADRFDVETHFDPTGRKANATHTPYGCFVENPGWFDPAFFNMSPREAEQTDPMHRLALVTAYEALERAGFVPGRSVDMHRIGTFYGQSSDDYREVNSGQEIGTYWIPGGCRAFAPGRINYFFGFGGPSFSCDTACSSSLASIQMACTSLWSGDTDMVVAGGMNILTNPDGFAGLSKGFFLSHTGNCKTWDSQADGYCRADGVGSVVMKRLEDALADNDNILGVVAAAATNHSAEAISITRPDSGAQSHLFRQVIGRAGIDPLDVGYVELHGTGTQAGDSNELKSVTDVFAPLERGRSDEQPLFISAAKANVGHGEAAAGIMALVKTLCVLQKERIPPHVGIKNELTPSFPPDADRRNLRIPYHTTPWPRLPRRKRIAIVNNFGAAGGNTSLAIEEGPERQIRESDPRSTQVLVVSAKNVASLERNVGRLLQYIRNNPEVALPDLAYTLTARKAHYSHRLGFAVTEASHLEKLLGGHLAANGPIQPVRGTRPPLAFAFTGQGSFYSSMASQLFHDSPPFRTSILHLDGLCRGQGFDSILPAMDGQAPAGHKFSLATSHLAITCVEMALLGLWEQLGVRPDIVVGHSLGEFAALHAAGVLSASDAIFLVGQRVRLLERATQIGAFGMMAVRAAPERVKKSIGDDTCHIACINGPDNVVLAGTTEALSSAARLLQSDGCKTLRLDIPHGFHSPQMDVILDDYERVAEGVVFHKPQRPVISPLLSRVVQEGGIINARYVRRATREAVDFMGALQAAEQSSFIGETTVWLELGPQPLCCGFVRSSIRSASLTLPSLCKKENNWATLSQALCELHCAGVEIDWKEFHRPYEQALRLLDLPTYAWNDKDYWIPYKGNWALTKGSPSASPPVAAGKISPELPPALQTSSIHGLVEEVFDDQSVKLVVESNILDPDLHAAVNGHAMNGFGVVSCMVHAEIAYTMARYLYQKLRPDGGEVSMSLQNFEYHEPVVARKSTDREQIIHTEGVLDLSSHRVHFRWFDVEADHWYSCATIDFENAAFWLADWARTEHFVTGRIDSLKELADRGQASKISRQLAYRLFANLVDWSDLFQGMQSVVLNGMEAYADVQLSSDGRGKWYVAPWHMESLVALSAFILNCTEVLDNKNYFFITPGYKSMRFARPLTPGGLYRSYVKMLPTGEPNMYAGDVYILDGSGIVGVMERILFRKWPRVAINRFFVPPETKKAIVALPAREDRPVAVQDVGLPPGRPSFADQGFADRDPSHPPRGQNHLWSENHARPPPAANTPADARPGLPRVMPPGVGVIPHGIGIMPTKPRTWPQVPPPPPPPNQDTGAKSSNTVARALAIISEETAIAAAELTPDTSFIDLGIDSLMSLVLAQKFRTDMGVDVRDSLFVEFPTIGHLCRWLEAS